MFVGRRRPGGSRVRQQSRRLEIRHGLDLTDGPWTAAEPFEDEIVHSDEILNFAQGVGNAVRHDDEASGSGLPVAGLQLESVLLPYH